MEKDVQYKHTKKRGRRVKLHSSYARIGKKSGLRTHFFYFWTLDFPWFWKTIWQRRNLKHEKLGFAAVGGPNAA